MMPMPCAFSSWMMAKSFSTSGGVRVRADQVPDDGEFLSKPYDVNEMVEAVREQCDTH